MQLPPQSDALGGEADAASGYVRPPQQKRSREAYNRVIGAAREILIEKGLHGFVLQDIAARAGISNGALHFRFASKERLLKTVIAMSLEDVVEKERIMHANLRQSCSSLSDFFPDYISRYWKIMAEFDPIFSSSIGIISADQRLSAVGRSVGLQNENMAKSNILSYFEHRTPELVGVVDAVYHIIFSYLLREIRFPSGNPTSKQVIHRTHILAKMCEDRLLLFS